MLTQETVLKVAKLARLTLTEAEAAEYQKQLENVLSNFQKIADANTEGVKPMITPTEIDVYWREDVVDQPLSAEDIVKNAPVSQGNLFKVPPVV